jgi:calcium/calmodulin-dependent protein kinase (CaM kinase) II
MTETHDEHTTIQEVLDLNEQLLSSIADGDWETYAKLCDPTLTVFEPETRGQLVEGLEFHNFYFDGSGAPSRHNTTVCSPHVRLLGNDAAILSYVRLVQRFDDSGKPATYRSEETRVWQRQDGVWRHVHFHRSISG